MKAIKIALLALALPFIYQNTGQAQQTWKAQPNLIQTRWAKQVSPNNALKEYPRPQLERKNWQNLNGLWEYAITKKDASIPSSYDGKILVPFPIESSLSGVKRELLPEQNLWYRRTIERSLSSFEKTNKRILLHFGAVDWQATVYLNGKEIGSHTGGYTAFSFDITEQLKAGKNELTVKVYDPTDKGIGPHGKQVLNPSNIYYTPSSGIWQTVWLETVPKEYIEGLKITPDVDKGTVKIIVNSSSSEEVSIKVFEGKREIASVPRNDVNTVIEIPIKNAKLWSPDDPFLYDLEVTLGKDKVKSYFGMRKISVSKDEKGIDRIMLNNKPYFNLGTLDQGFWPDGLYTAPTDEALTFDIKAIKAMGFNTIRKHIKVEPARWYYHADKLGMLVWQDMVNPNQGLPDGSKQAFEAQNKETIAQLYNNPSITTWVLFNEKWGQYDQARLTKELKTMDPSRLINGHSGEYLYVNNQLRSPSPDAYINADMTDVHSYPNPMISEKQGGKAQVLGEFGGIGVPIENHLWDDTQIGWGYEGIVSPKTMKMQYAAMIDSLIKLKTDGLSGSIYTQPFDVETEQNGIMTYDRNIIKFSIDTLRKIHQRLQLPTSNLKEAISDFSAVVAPEETESYADRVEKYKNGKKDSVFLRNLAIMAKQRKQVQFQRNVAEDYLSVIKNPLYETNLKFIINLASNVNDKNFRFLLANRTKAEAILDRSIVNSKLKEIIFNDEIKKFVETKETQPAWDSLETVLTTRYGDPGQQISWVAQYIHALNMRDYKTFINVKSKEVHKYPAENSAEDINEFAWGMFQNVNDKSLLRQVVQWMTPSIEQVKAPNTIDTYANLLYKLGRTQEAIEWEKKAVAQDPNEQVFKDTLEKMQKGLSTWPDTKTN